MVKFSLFILAVGACVVVISSSTRSKARRLTAMIPLYDKIAWGQPSPTAPAYDGPAWGATKPHTTGPALPGYAAQETKPESFNCGFAWKIGRLQCCVDNSFAVLAGVDLVEYFQIPHGSTAVAGNPDISTTIGTQNGDYTFFFKNNENKELFDENPWKYIPEIGGFDANAIAGGVGFQTAFNDETPKEKLGPVVDVNLWAIINNKLYMFGNQMSLTSFVEQQNALISKADLRWMNWFESRWVSLFSITPNIVLNTRCIVPVGIPDFNALYP